MIAVWYNIKATTVIDFHINGPKCLLKFWAKQTVFTIRIEKSDCHLHICEFTHIAWVLPTFQTTDLQTKSCLLSPTFVVSIPTWEDCVRNIKHSLLSNPICTLLIFIKSHSNYYLVPKLISFLHLFFNLKTCPSLHVSI